MGPGTRPATIKDVARLAGVSISTVSRVLNSSGPSSEETRSRVLSAADQLSFRPNALAKSMVTRSTGTLGLVIPDLRNPYFPALARGVEDTALKHGFTVMLGNSDNDPNREWQYVRSLVDKQVDGIILTGTASDKAMVRWIAEHGVPVVSPDLGLSDLADTVRVDQVASAIAATKHLLGLGHTRIAHIAAPAWTRTGRERTKGYKEALRAAGLGVIQELVRTGNFLAQSGMQAARELLQLPDPPTAIYAANDLMAVGAMLALTEMGRRVPGDVAVLGHGNVPFATLVTPPLSTIAESEYQWGETAVQMVLDRLTGTCTGPPRVAHLPFDMVIRRSCGAAGKGVSLA